MTTITIPAKDLAKGDLVTLSGEPFSVLLATAFGHEPAMVTVYLADQDGKQVGSVGIGEDRPLSVERHDPDEALIEAMAQATCADYCRVKPGGISWGGLSDEGRLGYLSGARAALAAARTCGAL